MAEGKVREIGCSNFDAAQLEEAAAAVKDGAPGFVSVQNEYSLLHRDPEDEVLGSATARTLPSCPISPWPVAC